MAAMNYLNTIERYHEYRVAIRELLGSILTGISYNRLFTEPAALREAMCDVARHFPFVSLLFTLDPQGVQTSDNVYCPRRNQQLRPGGLGKDRSQRPYFQATMEQTGVTITEPYLSSASGTLCISALGPSSLAKYPAFVAGGTVTSAVPAQSCTGTVTPDRLAASNVNPNPGAASTAARIRLSEGHEACG